MGGGAGGLNLGFGFGTSVAHHEPPQKLIRSDGFPNFFQAPSSTVGSLPSSTLDCITRLDPEGTANAYSCFDCTTARAPQAPVSFRSQGLARVMTQPYPLFTPGQWQELHRQALIYKYLLSSVPIPLDLLLGTGSFAPPYPDLGRGGVRFSAGGSADPEARRCRRTDGKKWRCSREAVPDQKYCERHLNRGRSRSRKPVERHAASVPSNRRSGASNWTGGGICVDFCSGGLTYDDPNMRQSGLTLSVEGSTDRLLRGGPLAEALRPSHAGFAVGEEGAACGSSYIDVMTTGSTRHCCEGEGVSPTRVLPSPTGALQRGTLVSLSDSSGNSSPTSAAAAAGRRRAELCLP